MDFAKRSARSLGSAAGKGLAGLASRSTFMKMSAIKSFMRLSSGVKAISGQEVRPDFGFYLPLPLSSQVPHRRFVAASPGALQRASAIALAFSFALALYGHLTRHYLARIGVWPCFPCRYRRSPAGVMLCSMTARDSACALEVGQ